MAATKIFCLLNIFNNYEIVSEQIIKNYISNGIQALQPTVPFTVQSLSDSTPFFSYYNYMLSGDEHLNDPTLTQGKSRQYEDYISVLGLTCVVLARIVDADIVISARQDMIDVAGFSTMLTIANLLNKQTIYWTDDLRNLWGTADDPLVIGMAPLPYRYFWGSFTKAGQGVDFGPQPHGLNGYFQPTLANPKNVCPTVQACTVENCWNTFAMLVKQAKTAQSENTAGTLGKHWSNLVTIGKAIINYVENAKDPQYGRGWNIATNWTMWYDLEAVIKAHSTLLSSENQQFITLNSSPSTTETDAMKLTRVAQAMKNRKLTNPFANPVMNEHIQRAVNSGVSKILQSTGR